MFYPIITTLDAGGGGRAGISKNVTYVGSQLTFMTQNEKVIIFRDIRRVTTDLHDTE